MWCQTHKLSAAAIIGGIKCKGSYSYAFRQTARYPVLSCSDQTNAQSRLNMLRKMTQSPCSQNLMRMLSSKPREQQGEKQLRKMVLKWPGCVPKIEIHIEWLSYMMNCKTCLFLRNSSYYTEKKKEKQALTKWLKLLSQVIFKGTSTEKHIGENQVL